MTDLTKMNEQTVKAALTLECRKATAGTAPTEILLYSDGWTFVMPDELTALRVVNHYVKSGSANAVARFENNNWLVSYKKVEA